MADARAHAVVRDARGGPRAVVIVEIVVLGDVLVRGVRAEPRARRDAEVLARAAVVRVGVVGVAERGDARGRDVDREHGGVPLL